LSTSRQRVERHRVRNAAAAAAAGGGDDDDDAGADPGFTKWAVAYSGGDGATARLWSDCEFFD